MLSEEEFNSLCKLARLDATDPSLKGLLTEFNQILEYVEQINEINHEEIGEYFTTMDSFNVMRPDLAGGVLPTEAVRKVAPEWEAGHFVVPKVVD